MKKNVIIVGGHEQACKMLDHLMTVPQAQVVLCIARKDDSGEDHIFPSLLKRAKVHNVPTLQPEKLNSRSVLEVAKRFDPDIVFSLQNNMLFKGRWLELMHNRLGIVNVHYAPLPRYGGYWPEMWAIWNGETRFAVSMHYVAEGIDTGPVIAQKWFDIDRFETRQSLYEKSSNACHDMLLENIDRVLSCKADSIPQSASERSYYPKSLPNDGFLDLSWDEETQSRFIRAIAFPGYPGPKVKIGDQIVTMLCQDIPFFKPLCIID